MLVEKDDREYRMQKKRIRPKRDALRAEYQRKIGRCSGYESTIPKYIPVSMAIAQACQNQEKLPVCIGAGRRVKDLNLRKGYSGLASSTRTREN
jgi:hypothetical protein